ncbi:hypothetical protein IQ251_16805 [Saccharopolyspora sp. HNM0983]|uniref:Uncharacterized protein n=1 Tax=Saccharopolyspora montiporae TaxID=2781240 RepID=A0A929BEH5_9PSEU|nr:hypothetical protein [Saccharopolyspora sp. HNM0983]MBE9376113.1 hypothetical protein [Saccharopolyspora sp. HNM0983]
MRLTLARPRTGRGEPPTVHAFPETPGDGPWSAVCGVQVAPGDVEVVDAFTGAPCLVCALSGATVSAAPAVPREEMDGPPVELNAIPVLPDEPAEPAVAGAPAEVLFALSWREQVIHRATADAPRVPLQGRTLVLGVCGVLGWGPLHAVPDTGGWEHCPDCDHASGTTAPPG